MIDRRNGDTYQTAHISRSICIFENNLSCVRIRLNVRHAQENDEMNFILFVNREITIYRGLVNKLLVMREYWKKNSPSSLYRRYIHSQLTRSEPFKEALVFMVTVITIIPQFEVCDKCALCHRLRKVYELFEYKKHYLDGGLVTGMVTINLIIKNLNEVAVSMNTNKAGGKEDITERRERR